MAVVQGLTRGERAALLLYFMAKGSGVRRNLDQANTGGGGVARARAEIIRLRNSNVGIGQVTNLDSLFDANDNLAGDKALVAALGFNPAGDDFYDPGGACPPAGVADAAIYQALKANL